MIVPSLPAALAAVLVLAPAAAQDARRLFDGRDLGPWRGDARYWSVEDGAIVGRTTAAAPLAQNTYLVLAEDVADFELTCRYRITSGNSGIQFRSRDLGGHRVGGYQADLTADELYTGILYEERGRGVMAWRGERVAFDAGGGRTVRGRIGTAEELQRHVRAGDWNDYRIVARGPNITLEINGQTMVEVEDRSAGRARSGIFALQLHAGPPMEVAFRDLVLRALPPADDDEPAAAAAARPEWIWGPAPAADGQRLRFRRTFEIGGEVGAARLLLTCDNHFVAWLNGERIASGDDWGAPVAVALAAARLAPGENVLAVEGWNDGGPAGLLVRLELTAGGVERRVVSGPSFRVAPPEAGEAWRGAGFDDSGWAAATSFGVAAAGLAPWGDPFAGRVATAAESLRTPDGFRAELLYSAGAGEGSWVSMCFDDRGRAIVAPERGAPRRLTFARGEVAVEELDLGFRCAHGLAFADGVLWANVCAPADRGGGLWRFRDTNGEGTFDDRDRLVAWGPPGEHGPHAVVPGPDGMLWVLNGNMSDLPAGLLPTSPHRGYADDLLLPWLSDPRGHAVGVRPPGAHVLRIDPATGGCELIAAGMRNPFDLAFDVDGEAFTFDADMEWDLGLPWYRPTRIVHLVSAAEFGWRTGSGKWPAYREDSLPAAVDVGLSSPTAVLFGTELAFPARYRRALLAADWAYGRILAVHLEPDGASYRGEFEELVAGEPLNVTDLVAGADGALYFTTGGRGTQSGLYRLSWNGEAGARPRPATDPARERRRALERWHRVEDPTAVDAALDALGDEDRFVRYAARIALERQPAAGWRERVGGLRDRAARTAWLALARAGSAADQEAVLAGVLARDWSDCAREERLELLRIVQVSWARHGAPAAARAAVARAWDAAFPTFDHDLDRELVIVLAFVRAGGLAGRALSWLERIDADPAQRLWFAHVLRLVDDGWSAESRRRYFDWLAAMKAQGGEGQSFRGYVERIAAAALERVPAAERAELAALLKNDEAVAVAAPAAFQRAWTLAELDAVQARVDRVRAGNGEALFARALCATCHRFAGRGGDLGPDLTGVAGRMGRRDLLEAIVDPSKVISDQYQHTVVELRDGDIAVGRVLEDRDGVLVLGDAFGQERTEIPQARIAARRPSTVSPMPPGLLNTLTLQEVLDLVAYLESGGR